jgi:elongation factor G
MALKDAAANGGLAVLEPTDEVTIHLPDDHLGTVLGDLSGRRGRVLGTESDSTAHTTIRAEVPSSALLRYAIELRSLTSGTATFTRRFIRYDPLLG